jgi:hypothetical protein
MPWSIFGAPGAKRQTTPEAAFNGGTPSAVDYVEWLPRFMLRTSCTALTIATDTPLPTSAGALDEDLVSDVPSVEAVLNRLKLVSGLNPVRCLKPTAGHFERARGGLTLAFGTLFEETPKRATCTIRMRVRRG